MGWMKTGIGLVLLGATSYCSYTMGKHEYERRPYIVDERGDACWLREQSSGRTKIITPGPEVGTLDDWVKRIHVELRRDFPDVWRRLGDGLQARSSATDHAARGQIVYRGE